MHKFLKQAVDEANKSTFRQKVGAIIFNKNRIISRGYNDPERSVKHINKKFQRWPGTVHAEVAAILKAKTDLKGFSILVVRVNSKNQLRLAKPCEWCSMYLDYVGIKKIYYSISEFPYIETLMTGENNYGRQ